ncbi:MAG: hypothetical protein XXXJIFNMEKO3_03371 [Candidatus Erwinia impunctatus]|nr:hypothetical protein XXXJIFNMEKO_03371 [Culicoides impunctatus]
MKINASKIALLVCTAFALSACSTQGTKGPNVQIQPAPVAATPAKTGSVVSEQYVQRKGAIFSGVTIASTKDQCIDNFNFLKNADLEQYREYTEEYNTINQGYSFLNINKDIMGKDARRVYTMALNIKLETLCSKLQYSGFEAVRKKIEGLSAL